jgi:general secretion pathway protein D
LSAPKVTTKSGASAEIKVVKELIYPTEYQQQAQSIGTTSSGNQSLVQIIVTPSAFETRDTGVILQVTPTVGPDNETIDLAMVPQVVELAEWIDYGSDVPTGDPTRRQHLTLNQPIFHSRSITTSISIWDGQTVVMGGLITEGQRNSEDKVPLLGDIPLLGYLFRSKTSQSVKKNLLIFVTANLVDPAGNKIKKETAASIQTTTASITTSANP